MTRALLSAALTLALLAGCRPPGTVTTRETRLLMDTYVTITARGPAGRVDSAIAAAFARLDTIDHRFNFLDSASPLHSFNFAGEPLADPELVGLVRAALAVGDATDGAFDITVEPLVNLWGFYTDSPAVPDPAALDRALRLVGRRGLIVSGDTVTKTIPGLHIDLGGIAKGYALAEAARVLRERGIASALIDAGGDVYAVGNKGDAPWRVGIRHPRADSIIGILAVADLAVVTSGDYERFFFGADSTRYCHIVDPRTGRPARGLAGVTVVAADPVAADAWATALFVLGPGSIELVNRTPGIEALLVTCDLRLIASTGLDSIFRPDSI